ncbi:MAG: transglutaminase family protein [Burkholderiaceae bacterium]
MIRSQIELLLSYQINGPAHLCFNIQAMRLGRQFVREESLLVTQGDGLVPPLLREFPGTHGSRFLRFDAQPGPLSLTYRAKVEQLPLLPLPDLAETTIGWLPDEMLRYLLPSRYVESDRLAASAQQLFGHLPPGLARVQQITAWIHDNISYLPGASSSETAASQVFEQRSGVCRDFAHLGIAFCRALNIPARLVVGYVWFDEPRRISTPSSRPGWAASGSCSTRPAWRPPSAWCAWAPASTPRTWPSPPSSARWAS